MTHKYFAFKGLLQGAQWISPAYIGIDQSGRITEVLEQKPDLGIVEHVAGYAIPGFQNAHSHAFQYAMAGLAEIHSTAQTPDDFWSWREAMYALALSISPDQMEAIATQLYAEMLRHGYTQVAEFHYVHHGVDGTPYENLAEMGARLVNAAKTAGIKITLVPMFYEKGGFGKEPGAGQRRFISKGPEAYQELLKSSEDAVSAYTGAQLGFGYHSLRAVSKESMLSVLPQAEGKPIHIHISEQLKEVEDCIAFYGKRPVEWLYDQVEVDSQWHLVHATHLSDSEVVQVAQSGAHVVLCPSTEGNLGDGIFRLKEYQELGGRWSIGTDSHIGLDPKEELRILDYGQRLTSHKRNTFYSQNNGDSGLFGYQEALRSGKQAMKVKNDDSLTIGSFLDAVVIGVEHPLIATSSLDKLLSTYLYAGDSSFNLGTLVNGIWKVKESRHAQGRSISQSFIKALESIGVRRK